MLQILLRIITHALFPCRFRNGEQIKKRLAIAKKVPTIATIAAPQD